MIRAWTVKFGTMIAAIFGQNKLPPSLNWQLDEMVCKIGGERMCLWRAVDDEGEVLDLGIKKRCDTRAALTPLKRLLRTAGRAGEHRYRRAGIVRFSVPGTGSRRGSFSRANCDPAESILDSL